MPTYIPPNFQPILLSFELALITTCILLIICLPLASVLALKKFRGKPVIEAIISLPLVLPPSVLGFYLLIAFSPHSILGNFLQHYFNIRLVFSFPGLVVGSVLYSLPFMAHPIQAGLQNLPVSLKEASYSLGKSRLETLFMVLLPNIKRSVLTGIVLSFAHTIGEFGVVLMIGGNIEGRTKVASIAIYDQVESLDFQGANLYSIILLILSFGILLFVYYVNKEKYNTTKYI